MLTQSERVDSRSADITDCAWRIACVLIFRRRMDRPHGSSPWNGASVSGRNFDPVGFGREFDAHQS